MAIHLLGGRVIINTDRVNVDTMSIRNKSLKEKLKMTKKIAILFVIVLLITGTYVYNIFQIFINSEQILYSKDNKFILVISLDSSFLSYGSNNKVLRLYTWYYTQVEKRSYGEHPLKLGNWSGKDINISIDLQIMRLANKKNEPKIKYIENWLLKNSSIGDFNIRYKMYFKDGVRNISHFGIIYQRLD